MVSMKKILVVICFFLSIKAANALPKLTVSQGNTLVLASLDSKDRTLPGIEAELFPPPEKSRFLVFTVMWQGTENGSVVVGNYSVDSYTADVWSGTVACYEETNVKLKALQRRMRKGVLHLSATSYQRLKTQGPLCE